MPSGAGRTCFRSALDPRTIELREQLLSHSSACVQVPLVMADEGYSPDASTLVIEAHLVTMYAPSFFTGKLVRIVGARWMLVVGSTLHLVGNAFLFATRDRWVFWVSLMLVGTGWNFNYVGASALVTCTYTPAERFKAQGLFDTVTLSGLAVALLCSGFTFGGIGWTAMYQVRLLPTTCHGLQQHSALNWYVLGVIPEAYWSPGATATSV